MVVLAAQVGLLGLLVHQAKFYQIFLLAYFLQLTKEFQEVPQALLLAVLLLVLLALLL
jgi:hypothetical protein